MPRIRLKLGLVFAATVASGMALGMLAWGYSIFFPFLVLPHRPPSPMSIFWSLGKASYPFSFPLMALASGSVWLYCLVRRVDPLKAVTVGYVTFVGVSKFGFPQYFPPIIVILTYWLARNFEEVRESRLLAMALAVYVGVISLYSMIFFLEYVFLRPWWRLDDVMGIAHFFVAAFLVLGLLAAPKSLLASVARYEPTPN